MITIRFRHPCETHLGFAPGDELRVASVTPALEQLLQAKRIDGEPVATILDGDEDAMLPEPSETAVLRRGRRRSGA